MYEYLYGICGGQRYINCRHLSRPKIRGWMSVYCTHKFARFIVRQCFVRNVFRNWHFFTLLSVKNLHVDLSVQLQRKKTFIQPRMFDCVYWTEVLRSKNAGYVWSSVITASFCLPSGLTVLKTIAPRNLSNSALNPKFLFFKVPNICTIRKGRKNTFFETLRSVQRP